MLLSVSQQHAKNYFQSVNNRVQKYYLKTAVCPTKWHAALIYAVSLAIMKLAETRQVKTLDNYAG